MRFVTFLDTEEVAGSNPVVPTIFRFRDTQDIPRVQVKPLENQWLLCFFRPERYRGSRFWRGYLGVFIPRFWGISDTPTQREKTRCHSQTRKPERPLLATTGTRAIG